MGVTGLGVWPWGVAGLRDLVYPQPWNGGSCVGPVMAVSGTSPQGPLWRSSEPGTGLQPPVPSLLLLWALGLRGDEMGVPATGPLVPTLSAGEKWLPQPHSLCLLHPPPDLGLHWGHPPTPSVPLGPGLRPAWGGL